MAVGCRPWLCSLHTIKSHTDGSACMTGAWPRLAAEAGRGAVITAVDASGVWSSAGGAWGPVETDPAAQLFLGAFRPTSPVAEVYCHRERVEDASGGSSVHPFDRSRTRSMRWESSWAITLPCRSSRWSKLHVARRDTAGNALASRAATRLHTRGLPATMPVDRLAEAGRRRPKVPEGAAALISCAQPILPEPGPRSVALADRIFWQGIRDEIDPLRPFRPGSRSAETVELTYG